MQRDLFSAQQESAHGVDHDYRVGSPHLEHFSLFTRLRDLIVEEVAKVGRDTDAPTKLLEIGAGHGGMSEPLLARGVAVTATEMSEPSCHELNRQFGSNPNFQAVFDANGDLAPLGSNRYQVILYSSVLHHIPDYLAAIEHAVTSRLAEAGSLIAIQDPLAYDGVPRSTRTIQRFWYVVWRLRQGNLRRGMASIVRRSRGRLDPTNPADTVEYHVVRNGVDSDAIRHLLQSRFESVDVIRYWSHTSATAQRLGTRLGLENTFAVVGRGYTPTLQV